MSIFSMLEYTICNMVAPDIMVDRRLLNFLLPGKLEPYAEEMP
jgi:hypothetical protein